MKKLLALVLALVMTLGLATISSNAAFTDAADVSLKEAVDVMSAVGVFKGNESGAFNPKGNLDRQSAAKLIAYLDLGESTAEALPAVQAFPDVPATNWAAKYVAYCKNAGYIGGDQNGNFLPATPLNGYSFGKMVLCVLGYDADIEGFTGSTWSINVAKLMKSNGIASGIDAAASETLTREQGAQYCLNALKATMVEYKTKGTSIEINGAKIASGAAAATAIVPAATAGTDDVKYNGSNDHAQQLAESLYGTKLTLNTAGKDAQGRVANVWTYKGDEVGKYAKSASTTFNVTSTSGSLASLCYQLRAKNSNYYIPTKGTAVIDGDFTTANLFVNGTGMTAGAGNYQPQYGDQIEVFTDSDDANKITNVVVTRYTLAKITKIDTNVSTSDKNDGVSAYLTLKNAQGTQIAVLKDTKIVGYDAAAYVKDAYLAAAVKTGNTEVVNSYLATKAAEGKVSTYDANTSYTIDGTAFKAVKGGTFVADYTAGDYDGTYAGYTDANGFLLGVVTIAEGHAAADAVYVNYIWSTQESGTYSEKVNTTYAQIVDMTGAVSTIVIGKTTTKGEIFGYISSSNTNANLYTKDGAGTYYAKNDGTVATETTNAYNTANKYTQGGSVTLTDKLYIKSEDSTNGYFKLAEYTNATDSTYDIDNNLNDDTLSGTALTKKSTKLGGYYVNADTQYIFVNGTGSAAKVTVKNGTNISYGTNIVSQIALYKTSGSAKVAGYVIIAAGYTEKASADVLYLKSATAAGTNANGTIYTFFNAEGNEEQLTVASVDTLTAGSYYQYTVNDKGAYSITIVTNNTTAGAWSSTNTAVMGARYSATFTSFYNGKMSILNTGAVSDIDTAKTIVVDLHETNGDNYNYNGANDKKQTYAGAVNSVDAIVGAADAEYTVTMNAYITDDGLTTIFVTDVSRATS